MIGDQPVVPGIIILIAGVPMIGLPSRSVTLPEQFQNEPMKDLPKK
jgi:hypothetical protein